MLERSRLNEQQRAAVQHAGGPLVVFAGAGSGKTMVITHRAAHLVDACGVPPWRILAVTFTNKAAGEMRTRLGALLPDGADDLWLGTFHATCARLLRVYADACGVKREFVIYDEVDQRAVLARLVRDLSLDERRFQAKSLAWRINRAKQEDVGPDDFEPLNEYERVVQRVYLAYEERLQKAGALDFDDLIHRLVRAMRRDAALLEDLRGRFAHVLVDEFQDTNRVQYLFVQGLCEIHRNLFVVGDDDQSIYGWRGADRRNILDFRAHFPDATVVKLEQNYRSTGRILSVANAVVSHNLDREPKALWTEHGRGDPVVLACCQDQRDEARVFLSAVRESIAEGAKRSDIALLYRTHAQSRVFEEALRAANIPYRVVGGTRFYDRAEIKDILAYLRVVQNPDDDVSLLRIVNNPPRGIGKTTVGRLLARAAKTGSSFWGVLGRAPENEGCTAAARKRIAVFLRLIAHLRELADAGARPVALAEAVLEQTEYADLLRAEDTAEADARLENIRELVESMAEFERAAEDCSLCALLEQVTLLTDVDRMKDEDSVALMTVHAAKGLEFPLVAVSGLEEGRFPLLRSAQDEEPSEDDLEEERRLAYVAFTRARRRLLLSWARFRSVYGQTRHYRPSRFLDEIPKSELKVIGVLQGSTRSAFDRAVATAPRSSKPAPGSHPKSPSASDASSGGDSYVDLSEGSDLYESLQPRPGMRVRHSSFGIGRVEVVTPGTPPRITVNFPGWGRKTIVATYLEPVLS